MLFTRVRRGTEKEEDLRTRLRNAEDEMRWLEAPGNADYTIVNDNLDDAYDQLKDILVDWYPQLLD